MILDYTSLLIAVGFAGAALGLTLFMTWISSRAENFLLTWAAGIAMVVGGVPFYASYTGGGRTALACAAFVMFTCGIVTFIGAAHQFRTRSFPLKRCVATAVGALALFITPFAASHDAAGFVAFNLVAALLLLIAAREYVRCHSEAPLAISILIVLYALAAVSFILCAIMIARQGSLVMSGPPRNWAEDLNVIVTLIGITGIGAISLSLHQSRLARRHHQASQTDSLTGLSNRRAMFERFGSRQLPPSTAVIVFDLDHFKEVNDRDGHGVGDEVITRFSDILSGHVPSGAMCARLGGEEFAVVLPTSSAEKAAALAERIRLAFTAELFETRNGIWGCTVSAGFAIQRTGDTDLESLVGRADQGLYLAKTGGRNRVCSADLRLVA